MQLREWQSAAARNASRRTLPPNFVAGPEELLENLESAPSEKLAKITPVETAHCLCDAADLLTKLQNENKVR